MKFPLRNPGWAAALSFLLPGLGQALGGKPGRGAVIAIPAVAFFFVFLPALLFANASMVGNSGPLTSLLVVDLIGCLYHVWAIVDAYREIKPPFVQVGTRGLPGRRSTIPLEFATLVGLVVATVGVHAYFGALDLSTCAMRGESCSVRDPGIVAAPTPSTRPGQIAGGTGVPSSATPSATPTPGASGSAAGASGWVAVMDKIRVHSRAGVSYPTISVLKQGQSITGQMVAGGAYTFAGARRTDWIKIDKGQPGAGGYVAGGYFLQTSGATPPASPLSSSPATLAPASAIPSPTA